MSLTWHIIAKDLRRLQLPLAIWTLLILAEHVFYAVIGGVWGPPNLEWLNRIAGGSELFLRIATLPVLAYFLIGALVYDDPLVETDPFWITRPISGRQLMIAKVTGAVLCFVLVPLVIKVAWWWACGLDAGEIVGAAGRVALIHGLLVAVGLTVAALTDGFPRYVMWTVAGFVVVVLINGIVPWVLGKSFGFAGGAQARAALDGLAVGTFVLAVAAIAHQFTTRRLHRSLTLVAAGLVLVCLGAHLWSYSVKAPDETGSSDRQDIQVALAGAPRFIGANNQRRGGGAPQVLLPLALRGAPKNLFVAHVRTKAEWQANGKTLWTANGGVSYTADRAALRRLLELPATPAEANAAPLPELRASLQLAPTVAQAIARTPPALHAELSILVQERTRVIEVPLRAGGKRGPGYSLTLSEVGVAPLDRNGRRAAERAGIAEGNHFSLVLTQRLGEFWTRQRTYLPNALRPFMAYALLNRRTGELVMPDGPRSGTTAFTALDQVDVLALRLQFIAPSTPGWLDDAVLVVVHFENAGFLKRTLDVNPFTLENAPMASASP